MQSKISSDTQSDTQQAPAAETASSQTIRPKRALIITGLLVTASLLALPLARSWQTGANLNLFSFRDMSQRTESFEPQRAQQGLTTDQLLPPLAPEAKRQQWENKPEAEDMLALQSETRILRKDKVAPAPLVHDLNEAEDTVLPALQADFSHGFNVASALIKTASLQLELDELAPAVTKIQGIVEGYKGYVVDASFSDTLQNQTSGHLQIKVPSAELTKALAEIEALGKIQAKQIRTEDLWFKLQQQKLEQERLAGRDSGKSPQARSEQQYQLKKRALERQQLEQMLKMATLDIRLSQRAPMMNFGPLQLELNQKLQQAVYASSRMLVDLLVMLPPLLLGLSAAWLGWIILRKLLVAKLELLSERHLTLVYLLAWVFFPLYALGSQGLGAALLFAGLIGLLSGTHQLKLWLKKRQPQAAEQASVKIQA